MRMHRLNVAALILAVCLVTLGTAVDATAQPPLEPGFPMSLSTAPAGPPTVVNVDVDIVWEPGKEIFYTDQDGTVHAIDPDGTPLPGWPRPSGPSVPGGAVAVGDLNDDYRLEAVVGTADGQVFAFDVNTGDVLPGFPVDVGGELVFVTVAPVAAPYPESIVAVREGGVRVLNHSGRVVDSWDIPGFASGPAAVGDVDDDDLPDIVVTLGLQLYRLQPGDPTPVFDLAPANGAYGVPVLVDLENDGPREILVRSSSGQVLAYEADGTFRWSFDTGSTGHVPPVVPAHIRGGFQPELIVATVNEIHMLDYQGNLYSGYPVTVADSTGWGGYVAPPVVNSVVGAVGQIIAGTDWDVGWIWDNFGSPVGDWPYDVEAAVRYSAAASDIDDDASLEIVMFTETELWIMDMGNTPIYNEQGRWEQWGGDPGHSFCYRNGAFQLVAGVEDRAPGSRVAFSAPSPNPTTSRATFMLDLPAAAEVTVAVYDIRGRRVRTLAEGSFPAGPHVVGFDGRDEGGRQVADGTYFARLNVRGTGRTWEQTRKLVVVR